MLSYNRLIMSFCSVLLLLLLGFIPARSQSYHIWNKGVPNNNTADLLRRLHRAVLKRNPSLVIIMIGTNDMVNPAKMRSYTDYRDALTRIVTRIQQQGSDVLLLSLPPVDTMDLFTRHNRKKYDAPPESKIDTANAIIKEISKIRHCMFLNINAVFRSHHTPNQTVSSLLRNKANSHRRDGVHPTAKGYALIAEKIAEFLKNHDKQYPRIICFGDSITFGAYAKGEGSTRKETYPAVLKRLLFP